MHRRRFAFLAAGLAAWPALARAQTAEVGGCSVGFVGGLLRFDPDCLLTAPGVPFAFAPPGHLATIEVDEAAMTAAADEQAADELARLEAARNRRDEKRQRRRERRRNRRERQRR